MAIRVHLIQKTAYWILLFEDYNSRILNKHNLRVRNSPYYNRHCIIYYLLLFIIDALRRNDYLQQHFYIPVMHDKWCICGSIQSLTFPLPSTGSQNGWGYVKAGLTKYSNNG